MGRPKLWKVRDLSPAGIISVYEDSKNLEEAATKLNICEKTLRTWFDEFGYGRKRGFPKGVKKRDTSCLAEWVRSHPQTPLPTSIRAIVELTGCSEAAVSSYLYRRRENLEARIKALPDLRSLDVELHSGLNTASIKSYTIFTREHSEHVKLTGHLRDGRKFSLITSIEKLEAIRSTSGSQESKETPVRPGVRPRPQDASAPA